MPGTTNEGLNAAVRNMLLRASNAILHIVTVGPAPVPKGDPPPPPRRPLKVGVGGSDFGGNGPAPKKIWPLGGTPGN